MLTSLKIYSESEIKARYEIGLENYCKRLNIEGRTMVDMARREILPAIETYVKELSDTYSAKAAVVGGDGAGTFEKKRIATLSALVDEIDTKADQLEDVLNTYKSMGDGQEAANYVRDNVLDGMTALRKPCDEAETLTSQKDWPFPTYEKLLFTVK